MKYIIYVVVVVFAFAKAYSQGPPITADKPIMLGGKSFTMKTLTEIRNTERGTIVYTPVMLHYLPTANSLIALHIPYTNYSLNDFEYNSVWLHERDWYQLLYAQGIQYALKTVTFDLAVQLPLIQQVDDGRNLNYSVFLGTRYTF